MFPLNLGINLSYMSVGSYYLLPRRIHTQFLPPVAMQVDLIYKELQVYATRHRVQPEGRGAGAGELQPDMCTSVRELINNLSNSANYVNMVAVQLDHQLTDCTEPNRTELRILQERNGDQIFYNGRKRNPVLAWCATDRERARESVPHRPPPTTTTFLPTFLPTFPSKLHSCSTRLQPYQNLKPSSVINECNETRSEWCHG